MDKPSDQAVEAVAPSYEVIETVKGEKMTLAISDGYTTKHVAQAELSGTLRLLRHDGTDSTLVALRSFYDGRSGGEVGHYVLAFIEFRANRSRWRTAGIKVRAAEALRIARDMLALKASKPGRNEAPRVGGTAAEVNESELRGVPAEGLVAPGGGDLPPVQAPEASYLLFVRHHKHNPDWVRTRGVLVLDPERLIVANMLRQLAKVEEG